MANQDVGGTMTGRAQQCPKTMDDARHCSRVVNVVTPSNTGAIVTDRTCRLGDNALYGSPTQRATRQPGFEDHGGLAGTSLVDVEPPAAKKNETSGRRVL